MKIVNIAVDQIDGSGRLRPVDEDYAAMIGASMAQNGQYAPVLVMAAGEGGKYRLIFGAHRLRGAQIAGLTEVAAIIRDVDGMHALLLETDENLTRHELNELDRAVFIDRRKTIYDELYPETKAGAARWKGQSDKFVVLMKSFSEATAEKLGCSTRSVERAVARARHISSEVRALLAGTWVARRGAHLDAIGRLTSDEQMAVARLLIAPRADDEAQMTVAETLRIVRQVPAARVDVTERDFKKLLRLWQRSDISARAKFRRHLAAEDRAAARGEAA